MVRMASVPTELSRILPITGNTAATESVPRPPMMDKPNGPDAVASYCMPTNENTAENHSIPTVLVFS